ncbi:hypothetical protein [Streptomyces sp. NPDC048521]|uniref:hypothetical protein n=1 Tax=Streptomyces sp. NPDC048521 TaxID=3365566 RepID=UPI003721E0DC
MSDGGAAENEDGAADTTAAPGGTSGPASVAPEGAAGSAGGGGTPAASVGREGAAGSAGGVEPGERAGRPAWLRKHRLPALAVAAALVAGAVAVPLTLAGGAPSCAELPASPRRLAENPAAATRALDPQDDMSRFDAVRALLSTRALCGDGGQSLGRVVDAATRAPAPDRAHTPAQARVVYAVAAVYHRADVPPGAAPGLARMLAGYVVDTTAFDADEPDANTPAVPGSSATPDASGWTRYGRFPRSRGGPPGLRLRLLRHGDHRPAAALRRLAEDPQAFAILYDAERAYLAHYLERLTRQGGDPDFHPGKDRGELTSRTTTWPDNDLEDIAGRIGTLLGARASGARDGGIADLASFDAAVRRYTRGAYRAAGRQLTSRPPMSGIAARPVSGPVRGDLMDGRDQMFRTLDAWAEARQVPDERANAMRQLLDDAYLKALRYGPL